MNPFSSCCHRNDFVLLTLFLYMSTLTMSTGQQQHLSITPHGTQIKTIDTGMIFTCTIGAGAYESSPSIAAAAAVPASSSPTIKWLAPRRQEITATAGRVYIERPDKWNLRLYITRIQESDAGLYTCESQMEPGKEWITEETRMFLYEDIRFADTRTEVRSLLGTSALLECTATGQPQPEITWRFNRRRITPDDDKYTVEEDGLRVNQLDLKDNGTYECRAEVESHGNVKIRSVSLEVIYPPVILQSPTADVVIKGQDTRLDCRADANPSVHYEWFKEQKMSEMIRVKVRLAEGTPSYVIRNVGANDEGRYFCRVSNYLGTREAYVDIKMLVPPEIRSLSERVSVAEGKSLNVTCEATGIPLPKITWKLSTQHQSQDAKDIDMAKLGAWMERTQPGQSALTIRNANRAHSGVLSCTAHNVAGTETRNVELTVEYAPSIDISLTEQLGWSGQTRVFSCVGRGIPLPSINWFRGEQYITDSDIYRITTTKTDFVTSVLTITLSENVPWAYGGYSCIAKNVHGYVTKDIRLTEATPPDMVRNVSVDKETPTSVTLTATAPSRTGGLPITSWMVTYESDTTPDAKPRSQIFHYGDRLQVTNLTAGSSYTFYLSASNAVGVSQPVKFRVSTPRRPALKEQSDVPERGDVNNDSFHDSLSSSSSTGGGKTNDHHKTKERNNRTSSTDDAIIFDRSLSNSGEASPDVGSGGRGVGGTGGEMSVGVGTHGNDSVLLAVAIGSIVVLTAIIVAMVCGFWWRRRRKASLPTWYSPAALGGPSAATPAASYLSTEAAEYFLGRPTDNCIMLLPTARQPTDPLPAVVALVDPDVTSQSTEMVEYRGITMMNASQTLPLVKSRTPKAARAAGSQAGSTTPRPCDQGFRTLQRCESGRVTVSHLTREDDGATGHPPPQSLYVLKPVGGGKVGQMGGGGGAVGGGRGAVGGGQKAALFIDEILDGYHSGDNVDDDIDNVDYTIKIPSYHDQVKG